jgi:sensor domain CHASE-containing protein
VDDLHDCESVNELSKEPMWSTGIEDLSFIISSEEQEDLDLEILLLSPSVDESLSSLVKVGARPFMNSSNESIDSTTSTPGKGKVLLRKTEADR